VIRTVYSRWTHISEFLQYRFQSFHALSTKSLDVTAVIGSKAITIPGLKKVFFMVGCG